MDDFTYFVDKVEKSHGHFCAGIALGTKITLAAMKALGLDPYQRNKNLIVYTEVDRCMTDAVQGVTGCSLGHRSLKFVNYGRFAATFVNTATGKAIRGTVKEKFPGGGKREDILAAMAAIPEDKLVTLQEVEIDIPPGDLPGSTDEKAKCSVCGEWVVGGRAVQRDGAWLCRACAGDSYYRVK